MDALIELNHNPLACLADIPEAPVISGPLAATEGQRVNLNCTVRSHCPSTPPTIRWIWEQGSHWNNSEHEEVQMVLTDPYRPTLRSSLSFTTTYKMKPRIKCEVRHPGVRPLVTAKSLHITCEQSLDFTDTHKFPSSDTLKCMRFDPIIPVSPKDVVVHVNSLTVQEGGSALLECSCKADPPAFEYHWSYSHHGHMVHLHKRASTVRISNVTRNMTVRCSAKNIIGKGESQPTRLDVHCNSFAFCLLIF